jgi:hypothetical protein
MSWFEFKYWLTVGIARVCCWVIRKTNRCKDRLLASILLDMAYLYDTRPPEDWEMPKGWDK